jgi:hypothetical protein
MKMAITCFLIIFVCLYSGRFCFAQEKTVTAEKLTPGDVKEALLSGAITSNCRMRGSSGSSAASLNPDTVIIKGIYQKDGKARIFFMGKVKKNIRANEMIMGCEANLVRLDNGQWMDPDNNGILKK